MIVRLCFLLLFSNGVVAQSVDSTIEIIIKESNSWCNNTYSFKLNSISIKRDAPLIELYDSYNIRTDFPTDRIKTIIYNTSWDSVKDCFSNYKIDDNLEYDIVIRTLGKTFRKQIYMTEYIEYIELIDELNKLIPDHFKIEYGYNYLHGKLRIQRGPMSISK